MSNDIDLYSNGSDIQPYSPDQPLQPLQPLQPDTWGVTDVDVLTPRESHSGLQLFGQPLPSGTTPQQVQATLGQLGGIFLSDFSTLGYPSHFIQSSIQFFMDNATRTPQQVRRQHSFSLPKDLSGDWLAESFGNHLDRLSGTQAQKQQFLNATLQWLNKLSQHLNAQGSKPAQGRAPASYEDSLWDAEWAELDRRNEALKARTENTLRRRWGTSYTLNVQVAQEYLNNLPARERKHFDQITSQGAMLNSVEALTFLFDSAIGKASIPTSGGAVNQEINQIEQLMKVNPKAYFKDNQIQARLRELYNIRDKGNP